jgi:hypothetical protein
MLIKEHRFRIDLTVSDLKGLGVGRVLYGFDLFAVRNMLELNFAVRAWGSRY